MHGACACARCQAKKNKNLVLNCRRRRAGSSAPLNISANMLDYPASGASAPMSCFMPLISALELLKGANASVMALSVTCYSQAPPPVLLFKLSNGIITGPGGVTITVPSIQVCVLFFVFVCFLGFRLTQNVHRRLCRRRRRRCLWRQRRQQQLLHRRRQRIHKTRQ